MKVKRKIRLRKLHFMARQMKYVDFENWIAEQLFDIPSTVKSNEHTDKLFLTNDETINTLKQ